MSFSEQVPSTEWVTLKHMGEDVAEAWLMPEGERSTLVFLVPRSRLESSGSGEPVTVAALLAAAAVSQDAVESWRLGDDNAPGRDTPLPPPPPDDADLTVYVRLKPLPQVESGEHEISQETWQSLDTLWKAILGLEASVDAVRLSMDGLRNEMETAYKKPMTVEDKNHALQSDVAQWTKAKNRVHHALPKAREFIHRATWSLAVPERKRLEEIVRNHIEPRKPFAGVDQVRAQLEHLQKDRQVLFAQGTLVGQDCRGILAEIQTALRTLQRNAADRARQKRSAARDKGKHS